MNKHSCQLSDVKREIFFNWMMSPQVLLYFSWDHCIQQYKCIISALYLFKNKEIDMNVKTLCIFQDKPFWTMTIHVKTGTFSPFDTNSMILMSFLHAEGNIWPWFSLFSLMFIENQGLWLNCSSISAFPFPNEANIDWRPLPKYNSWTFWIEILLFEKSLSQSVSLGTV